MMSKIFEKKGFLKFIKGPLGSPKSLKFAAKQLKFDALKLGSKIPIRNAYWIPLNPVSCVNVCETKSMKNGIINSDANL